MRSLLPLVKVKVAARICDGGGGIVKCSTPIGRRSVFIVKIMNDSYNDSTVLLSAIVAVTTNPAAADRSRDFCWNGLTNHRRCYSRRCSFHTHAAGAGAGMINYIAWTDRRRRTLLPMLLQHHRPAQSLSTATDDSWRIKTDPLPPLASDSDTLHSSTAVTVVEVGDIGSTWLKRTQQLLDQPVGSFHEETWAEAIQILKYWFTLPLKDSDGDQVQQYQERNDSIIQDDNAVDEEELKHELDDNELLSTSMNKCFLVLDRLLNELKKNEDGNRAQVEDPSSSLENQVPTRLSTLEDFNPIIKLWRHAYRVHCSSQAHGGRSLSNNNNLILTPSVVAQRLSEYADVNLIEPDGATYSMIFDAASYDPQSIKDGVLFADRYLDEWQTLYDKGLADTKPDIVVVGSVVHAWAESDLPEAATNAERWVSTYLKDTGAAKTFVGNEDHTKLYSSVMLAWARIGKPRDTQKWMNRLQKETKAIPDVTAWSILLLSLANANAREYPNAAFRAEQVLVEMEDLHRHGKIDKPNVFAYTHAMEAWHKRSRKNVNAASRALTIFEKMKRNGLLPTTVSYNTAISSLARAGDIHKAEDLLKEMISAKADVVSPDVRTFTAILSGLSRVGTVQSAERAESLVSLMRDLGIIPTTQTYSACISCWAHVAGKSDFKTQKKSVERSHAIFDQMKEVDKVEPDVYVYTSLLNVYAKCGRSHCAQQILDEFLALYQETGRSRLAPTVQTFSTVLSAWSRSKVPDAAEKARQLLHRMENEFHVVPNVYCYSAVLDAYSKCKKPKSVETARDLFEDLRSDRVSVIPNAYCYNAMIQVYANVGLAEEAESLLEEMLSGHSNQNDAPTKQKKAFIKPTAHNFSSVIHAWSKSYDPQAGERAEKVLQKMKSLYQSGDINEPPNLICFNAVMSCWAHSPSSDGPQRAEDWLRQMQAIQAEDEDRQRKSSNNRPRRDMGWNKRAYNVVMNAWANRGECDRVERLFDELVEISHNDYRLKPDEYTYRAVLKAIHLSTSLSEEEKAVRKENFLRSISASASGTTTQVS
mmetsp:Transcript_1092/g.2406  ORF Transcript_1092/g.2406 Transcript_1092/m.2406 type:complete len:1042 (+) Transcript_1092:154-3279(+)